MDWLLKMNDVIEYIEEHLDGEVDYNVLANKVCCSVYEFSRIFSFMSSMSVSEYVRRRRLSQAALDITMSNDKIIDIALKYQYESQAAFSRAFKDLHGKTPTEARLTGTKLRTYPKLSFQLTIKGVERMNFRIEEKAAFTVIGLKGMSTSIPENNDTLDPLWRTFMDHYNSVLYSESGNGNYYHEPLWQVGAYQNTSINGKTPCIVGAELGDKPVPEGMDTEIVEASTWAVFEITGLVDKHNAHGFDETYARIYTEWFPTTNYIRNPVIQNLEVFGPGDASAENYTWEIWIPILKK